MFERALQMLSCSGTHNLHTNIVDFGGFDSSIMFCLMGGIPRPIGDFPESLSQAMLVGIMLVGRLGVLISRRSSPEGLAAGGEGRGPAQQRGP